MYLHICDWASDSSNKLFYRYSQFYMEDSFCHYNMFNHHFFDGKVRTMTIISSLVLENRFRSTSLVDLSTICWYLFLYVYCVFTEQEKVTVLFPCLLEKACMLSQAAGLLVFWALLLPSPNLPPFSPLLRVLRAQGFISPARLPLYCGAFAQAVLPGHANVCSSLRSLFWFPPSSFPSSSSKVLLCFVDLL